MNGEKSFLKLRSQSLVLFLLISACVEKIEFDVPPAQSLIVIEGMISDQAGPYAVRISRGLNLDQETSSAEPVEDAVVKLHDDEGNVETMIESSPGNYVSNGVIQGRIGRSYFIEIETSDGSFFTSEPERLNPPGKIEEIRFEYEARTVVEAYGEVPADVFNVYVDASGSGSQEEYFRWKFTGTFKVITWPELRMKHVPPYTPYKDPPPCSGYIVVYGPGGLLQQIGECTCCTCWVSQFELLPQISDNQLVTNNQFSNVKVAEVPINNATFHEKFMVEVDQMSMTRTAYEFFKLIREQKENASNLFQVPPGEVRGNIIAQNANTPVVGMFWATAIDTKWIFINKSDVPYPVTPIYEVKEACTVYPNATSIKPEKWE